MVYVLAGFESDTSYASRRPEWEPEQEHDALQSALSAGQRWLQERPRGQVEVIELLGADTAVVVRVVTPRGVEVIEPPDRPGKRRRLKEWIGRPPQVFAVGALFVVVGIWMVASPETFDNRPSSFVRGLGVISVVFFGFATLVAFARWRRAGGRP
jgi:hypothetical protein